MTVPSELVEDNANDLPSDSQDELTLFETLTLKTGVL